jgi:glycosyltransferase involved in cell wall biosynthesis
MGHHVHKDTTMRDFSALLSGKTIVQIVPQLDAGGVERTTVDVAAALAAQGARPVVLSEGGRLVPELALAGGIFRTFPAATKNPARILANAQRLMAILREERSVILHARSRAPAWSALMAARALKMPLVTTWAGAYSAGNAPKRLYNSVMARGDAVIANSAWTAERIIRDNPQARARTTVIHRGTDLARFDPAAIAAGNRAARRAEWGVPEQARVVLVAARLTAWKGQTLMIEALAALPSDVVVVFAGDAQGRDGYVAELKAQAVARGLSSRIFLIGHVADIAAAIAACDAVAVPSLEPEAFGRSAVEAQALGVPVVVSDHGAAPETVLSPADDDGSRRTGWRVPPGDAAALAQALGEALALTSEARAALATRAREHVAEHFSLRAMTDATLALYARLITSG